MNKRKPEYVSVLEQNKGLEPGEVIREKLNESQQQQVIEDILSEQVNDLSPYLRKPSGAFGKEFQMASLFYSPADLAFDFLSNMGPDWINQHASFLENRFKQAWQTTQDEASSEKQQKAATSEESLVLEKIKTLVANSKAGFRPDFLDQFIQSHPLQIEEELEFYLLWAKIEEREGALDIDSWSDRIHIDEKPELSALFLYILRKENPLRGIKQFLLIESLEEKPSPQLIQFFTVYLKQTIYQLLNEAESNVYVEYLKMRESISREWLDVLFDEVMEHPALEEINENYKKVPAILQGNSEQHQKRVENFEESILKDQ